MNLHGWRISRTNAFVYTEISLISLAPFDPRYENSIGQMHGGLQISLLSWSVSSLSQHSSDVDPSAASDLSVFQKYVATKPGWISGLLHANGIYSVLSIIHDRIIRFDDYPNTMVSC
jgi:hypothetical protein